MPCDASPPPAAPLQGAPLVSPDSDGGSISGVVLRNGYVFISHPPSSASVGLPARRRAAVAHQEAAPPSDPPRSTPVESVSDKASGVAKKRRRHHHCQVVKPQQRPPLVVIAAPERCDSSDSTAHPLVEESGVCRPQAAVLLSNARCRTRDAFFAVLWQDLFPTILAPFLTVGDVTAVSCVCRAARLAAGQPCIWRTIAVCSFGVQRPAAVEALAAQRRRRRQRRSPMGSAQAARFVSPPPVAVAGGQGTRPGSVGELLTGFDSQVPTPCERGGSGSDPTALSPTSRGCSAASSDPDRCLNPSESAGVWAAPAGCVATMCSFDTSPPPLPLPLPPARRAPFPWRGYVRRLHRDRVSQLLEMLRQQERAQAEDDDGEEGDTTPTASKCRLVRQLTYSINVLSQKRAGGPPPPEHIAYLANALTRRGELLLGLAPSPDGEELAPPPHRLLYLALAVEDLSVAELLQPADTALTTLVDMAIVRLEGALAAGGEGAAQTMSDRSLADWLAECDLAAQQPRPFALLAVYRRLRYHALRGEGGGSEAAERPRQQHLLIAALSSFLHVYEVAGLPLTHLLVEAAACAATPQERLIVSALRHFPSLPSQGGGGGDGDSEAAAAAAVDSVELALSLLPCAERAAVVDAARVWQEGWLLKPTVTLAEMVRGGLTHHRFLAAAAPSMSLETATLLSLAYYSVAVAYSALGGRDPVLQAASPSPRGSGAALQAETPIAPVAGPAAVAMCEALVRYLALSQCHHWQANALVRLAALYADRDEAGAPLSHADAEEDRLPMPLPAVQRDGADAAVAASTATTGAAVALRLLHTAVHVSPMCVPAHVLLSRLYVSQERGERVALPPLAITAYELLSGCLHRYAVPFLPSTDPGAPYLHRKDRHPRRCYIPAALLCERSGVAKGSGHRSLADLYEATLHDPCASYPRRVKAALALDAAAHLQPVVLDGGGGGEVREDGEGEVEVEEEARDMSSAFVSLFATADAELRALAALRLQDDDAVLRLRVLADFAEPLTTASGSQDWVRVHRLQTALLHQLGLVAVLKAGRATTTTTTMTTTTTTTTTTAHADPFPFPALLENRVGEGLDVFLSDLERCGMSTR